MAAGLVVQLADGRRRDRLTAGARATAGRARNIRGLGSA
jgi:hypothetical protein